MSDIAFKVLIGNGYDDVLFKTIMLKGEKGDKGEAGGAEIDDSTISASKTWSSNKINSEISAKPSAFSQLSDVAISNISDGQMAVYNSATGKWKNQNVDASTLKYNSTKTIKAELDAKASSLTDLDDVSITNPQNEQGVIYDATTGKWKNGDIAKFTNTASDSLVHITDGADNIPVKSLVSEIVAVESGNGQPKSPTNPYTISGFDNGVVSVCGVNLWNEDWEVGNYQSDGTKGTATNCIRSKTKINIKPNTSYYMVIGLYNAWVCYYDNNGSFLSGATKSNSGAFTTPNNAYYMAFSIWSSYGTTYGNNISINYPSTDTQYHAYNGNTYTFAFGQTVYGGYFDNKGNLVVTHGIISDLGSLAWGGSDGQFNYNFNVIPKSWTRNSENWGKCSALKVESWSTIDYGTQSDNSIHGLAFNTIFILRVYASDYSTADELKTALSGQSLVYELANPITLAITSQDIPTLLGENNIFSNCGDVEVTYYTYKSNDILDFIDSEIGKKNGTNILIEENSPDSIKDYIDNEVSTINTSLSGKADKTEDGTITMASGYSLISSSCGKTDRFVHLNFNVEKTGGFATGWQAIGTTEFKPNTLAYCPLWNVTNGVANGEVRIDTDGTINFYVITAGELRLNANIGYITN